MLLGDMEVEIESKVLEMVAEENGKWGKAYDTSVVRQVF